MPNQNTRPRYYELCATFGMLIGCRVIDNPLASLHGYVWRSYAVGEEGVGQVHKSIGPAWESALHQSGFRVRGGKLQKIVYDPPYLWNRRTRRGRAMEGVK